jgi:cytochrome P450
MGLDFITSVTPYGDIWRTARKLLHAHLHQGVVSKYHPTQITSARNFAQDILITRQDADALSPVVSANFGRTIIKMVYGIDTEEAASEQLSLAEDVLEAFSTAFAPGRFLVDSLEFCKWFCSLYF